MVLLLKYYFSFSPKDCSNTNFLSKYKTNVSTPVFFVRIKITIFKKPVLVLSVTHALARWYRYDTPQHKKIIWGSGWVFFGVSSSDQAAVPAPSFNRVFELFFWMRCHAGRIPIVNREKTRGPAWRDKWVFLLRYYFSFCSKDRSHKNFQRGTLHWVTRVLSKRTRVLSWYS